VGDKPISQDRRVTNLKWVLLLPITASLALSGCMVAEIMDYGVKSSAKSVTDRCGRGYTVYEKDGRLLVMAYAIAEAAGGFCQVADATGVRYEAAAAEYLAVAKNKQQCTLGNGRELSPLHTEFTFSCA
jgi:hypothetical protein